jgi:hypothetical protein
MTHMRRNLIAALGVASLAIPSAAIAKPAESHGHGHGGGQAKVQEVAYVFKGIYAGEGKVEVKAGNSRVRRDSLTGTTVSFDLAGARIVVADTNGDGQRNLEDVMSGDKVLVKATLPKGDPGTQPFAAGRLVDQAHPTAG